MKFSWKSVVLAVVLAGLSLGAAVPSMADGRGDRQRDRFSEFDRRGEVRERRREDSDRARDRRRHLSDDERARLRRDVLEAFRAGREGR